MKKKLYILQIFSNFVIEIKKQLHQSDMDNFFAKFISVPLKLGRVKY